MLKRYEVKLDGIAHAWLTTIYDNRGSMLRR